ncbi:hypothetical protein DH2020_004033 [Rehmannia glutinosa]|uniref:Sialate O-acetylesterase domain-containing protein n=1 Tax=Rehmannia glutinosa TaxID=99300 RepID=A0ABR0XNB2_REHGL
MSGRGGVVNETWDGFILPECQSNPLILRLDAALTWEEAQEPLHRDIDVTKTCGIGPGMAFSNLILEKDLGIGVIGLVPCAIGGTNISEWRRGGRLYNQVLSRAQAALHGGGGLIRAILWYQGESDTIKLEDAKLYKRRLEKFLQLKFDPICCHLSYLSSRKSQMEIDVPNVRCVDAKGLQLQPDGLHLSTAAQLELGRMMADAFLQIMAPLSVRSSAPKRSNNP